MSASPSVVRVWMPLGLGAWVCLFVRGMPLVYWVLALPMLLTVIFMSTLAEVRDDGHRIMVKTLWNSIDVPKEEVMRTTHSFLDGIGVLQLRRFVFPWGRIYFVTDWSKLGVVDAGPGGENARNEARRFPFVRASLETLVVALSGFLAARAMSSSSRDFRIETSPMRMGAYPLAAVLCVVFLIARKRRPSFANVVLFVATFVVGLVHW